MNPISEAMKWMWRRWTSTIHRINDVISFVLMTITYVIAVTPVSLIMKSFNSDIIDRGLGDPETESYWNSVCRSEQLDDISRVQRQY